MTEESVIDLAEIALDAENARHHSEDNLTMIRRSLAEYRAGRSILIDGDNTLIAGEGVTRAARELGYTRVRVIDTDGSELIAVRRADLTAAQRRRLALLDNRTTETSTWDNDVLAQFYHEDPAILDGIFTNKEVNLLVKKALDGKGGGDAPVVPSLSAELLAKWQVKPNDVWQIPSATSPDLCHRLICGDSTDTQTVNAVLNGDVVHILLTDPPYGVNYADKNRFLNEFDKGNRVQLDIENDAIEDYREFFASFLRVIPWAEYNTLYIFMLGAQLHNLRLALDDTGCFWGDYLVWVKNNHVLGRKDYNAKHEFILYGWHTKHKFYGDFSISLLEFDRNSVAMYHPTEKPINLLERLISDGSLRGQVVYDAFAGSGTSLCAAENMGRVWRGIELAPEYCAVTLERAALMGLVPTRL